MKTFISPGKFTVFGFKFFSLFLFNKILQMSLRRFNFMMTFFGKPLKGKRWQSLIKLGSIGTLISVKTLKTFDLRSLSARLAGIPEISIYSLQEHYLLAQYNLSIVTSPSDSLVYMIQVTYILVSRVQESLTLTQMDHFLSRRCQ